MGFFRRIFGAKKSSDSPAAKEKRQQRWSFSSRARKTSHSKSVDNDGNSLGTTTTSQHDDNFDANKHAIAVAAATAAVAEAALAAAHAAAEVVRLTSGTTSRVSANQGIAAVKIQSAFRGYLARRALRALKALVKLQALVRGHIVRKQTADMLRRMQTLVRLQARARASRTHLSDSLHSGSKSSLPRHPVYSSPRKNDHQLYSTIYEESAVLKRCGSNSNLRDIINLDKIQSGWFDHWVEENIRNQKNGLTDDEKSDKILEVDTGKPQLNSQYSNQTFNTTHQFYIADYSNQSYVPYDSPSKFSTKAPFPNPSISSGEVLSSSSVKYPIAKDEVAVRTTENSPQVYSASSRPGSSTRRGPFTPARSECSWGFFSGYASYPNYMANTESSRAKVRSQSAPRQRLDFERYGSSRRSIQRSWDADTISEKGFPLRSDIRNNAYSASASLNRQRSSKLR